MYLGNLWADGQSVKILPRTSFCLQSSHKKHLEQQEVC